MRVRVQHTPLMLLVYVCLLVRTAPIDDLLSANVEQTSRLNKNNVCIRSNVDSIAQLIVFERISFDRCESEMVFVVVESACFT
jgi:hypothetical protein